MNNELQKELPPSTKQQAFLKISERKAKTTTSRICQGDIFENVKVIENIEIEKKKITVKEISFPYVVCLNQECDLENDYRNKGDKQCDGNLLHIAIAPTFIFDQYLTGSHWGDIFRQNNPQKRSDTTIKKIIENEIPRYHYLFFPDKDMPELIIDFKHFFTINATVLYTQIEKRLCSLDNLFREKVNHRFSYYISRIGLPEHQLDR